MHKHPLQPLGIGFPYIATLPATLYQQGLLDFIELTPETICRQRLSKARPAIEINLAQLAQAQHVCQGLPLVIHGVELSIASAHGWNEAYLKMLDSLQSVWPFVWHSEHLSFQTIPGEKNTILEIGVPLPVPMTQEAVTLISARVQALHQRYSVPFLLENPAHYFGNFPADPEIGGESGFMHAITEKSGSYLLLDLHNLYCNAVNHGFDPFLAIAQMPLRQVVEIHLAGGSWRDGFYMDAHDGRVPEDVWNLLEYTLPLVPNVAGVVFEILDEPAVRLGTKVIAEELQHARQIWNKYRSN